MPHAHHMAIQCAVLVSALRDSVTAAQGGLKQKQVPWKVVFLYPTPAHVEVALDLSNGKGWNSIEASHDTSLRGGERCALRAIQLKG